MFNSLHSNKYSFSANQIQSLLTTTFLAVILSTLSFVVSAQDKVSVMHEDVINKDAASVWELVGDFNGLNVWHPAVAGSELQGERHNTRATHAYSHWVTAQPSMKP